MPSPYQPPRARFGFGPRPLPGNENPILSQTAQERFSRAGLDPFLPYLSPYETLARAQEYKNFDRYLQDQDMEDQFFESVRSNPTTGYQKFLAENPMALTNPRIRVYAQMQQKMNEPVKDEYAEKAAEGGTEAYKAYRDAGGGVAGFAAAQDQIAKAKAKQPSGMALSGEPRERFDALVRQVAESPDYAPSDEEKQKFLDPSKKEWSEKEWTDAYHKAREAHAKQAVDDLGRFQQTYSQFYKVPNVLPTQAAPAVAAEPAFQPAAPFPPPNRNAFPFAETPAPVAAPNVPQVPPSIPASAQPAKPEATAPKTAERSTTGKPVSKYGFSFQTYGEKNPDPLESLIKEEVAPAASLAKNVAGNIANDPLGRLSDLVIGGDTRSPLSSPAPGEVEHVERWNEAKNKVLKHIRSLDLSPDELNEKLGTLAVEETVPPDYFMPKGSTKKDKPSPGSVPAPRVPAGVALLSALGLDKPGPAFRGKDGNVSWNDVARVVAQDVLSQKGELRMENRPEVPIKGVSKSGQTFEAVKIGRPQKVQ